MMSKIKSRKIANFKILIGFVLAASLVVVFACEQKESIKTEIPSTENTMSLNIDGHALNISGDSAGIKKLQSMIDRNDVYKIERNLETGATKLFSKSTNVDEVAVVAYGSQEKSAKMKDDVFFIVETMPEYPGGQLAVRKFIATHVMYPDEAKQKGIQGKVFVSFVVEKDGSVGDVKIARGVDPSLDKEALRVVSLLSDWTPGKQKGKAVRVSYTIPINFALQ